ncbi:hypothetical protein [Elizabethkingia meningoseptica]|uniref:hypothetical protein n=1 Tax=Elizabethkingia meningoseptica TaxID=238 RepID=UPI00301A5E84
MRIDSSPINYFLRAYFQYVLIPVIIMASLWLLLPNDENYPPVVLLIISVFTLACMSLISFSEYFSLKKKVGTSTLFVKNNQLFINNRNLSTEDIKSITPLYYNPIRGKTMIHFLEIKTDTETFYFFDKPHFIWRFMTSPVVAELKKYFSELQPVIKEEIRIRELPNSKTE